MISPRPEPLKKGRIFNHRDGMSELERFEMEQKPEPRTAEQRVNEFFKLLFEFKTSDILSEMDTKKAYDFLVKEIQQAIDEARAEALEAMAWGNLQKEAYAKGFSEGASSMRERAAKLAEINYDKCPEPDCNHPMPSKHIAEEIRALPLSEAEGGKSE